MGKIKDWIIGLWKKNEIAKSKVSPGIAAMLKYAEKQRRRIEFREEIVAAEMKEEEEEELLLLSLESFKGDDDSNSNSNLPSLNLKLVIKLRTLIKDDVITLHGLLQFNCRFNEQPFNSDSYILVPALYLYFAVARDIQHHISSPSSTITTVNSSNISQLQYPLLPELQAWIQSPGN